MQRQMTETVNAAAALDWAQIQRAGYPGLLKVIQGLAARIARLESANGRLTGHVVGRVAGDFGHGGQVVAEDAASGESVFADTSGDLGGFNPPKSS